MITIESIQRKIWHFTGILIPIVYHFVPEVCEVYFITLGVLITVFSIVGDYFNIYVKLADRYNLNGIKKIMKEHEKLYGKLSGTTWLLVSSLILMITMDKDVTIISILVLIVCDPVAAIFGTIFGKKKFFGKTIEGALGFFVSGVFLIYIYSFSVYDINFIYALCALIFTTFIEFLSKIIKIDDNFIIPISFAICLKYLQLF